MGKENGSRFVLESGSKQSFRSPRRNTMGGVCEAAPKVLPPAKDIAPTVTLPMVRPHGWRATQERNFQRVSSGMRR